jgi:hypothetical protein
MNPLFELFIIADLDPYFSKGLRADLRYISRDYLTCTIKEFYTAALKPIDYLRFAKADIMSKDLHGSINSITNCKKAIHLLIDYLLKSMGFDSSFLKMSFPKKIDLLEKIEAIPTNLLQSLNRTRNVVEHEYSKIEYQDALNFVEISELFIRICYPMLRKMTFGSRIGLKNSTTDFEWIIDLDKSLISINECHGALYEDTEFGRIYYNFDPEKETKTLIKEVKIQKENENDWLSYLSAFYYCTNANMILPDRTPYDEDKEEKHIKWRTTIHI